MVIYTKLFTFLIFVCFLQKKIPQTLGLSPFQNAETCNIDLVVNVVKVIFFFFYFFFLSEKVALVDKVNVLALGFLQALLVIYKSSMQSFLTNDEARMESRKKVPHCSPQFMLYPHFMCSKFCVTWTHTVPWMVTGTVCIKKKSHVTCVFIFTL